MNAKKELTNRRFRIASALIILLLILSSCGADPVQIKESRIIQNNINEWNGWPFFQETFRFSEKANPDRENSKMVERTGYRLMMKNPETGEIKCPCIIPDCDHSINSGCLFVSRFSFLDSFVVDEYLFIYCSGQYYPLSSEDANDRSKSGFYNELKYVNLVDGNSKVVFSYFSDYTSNDYLLGDSYVWYILPDVADKKVVYKLKRFDFRHSKTLDLTSFDDCPSMYLLTDSRIYLGRHPLSVASPDDLNVISFDYDGKNSRDEPSLIASRWILKDTYILSRARKAVSGVSTMIVAPRFTYFNVATREERDFSDGENVNAIGFRETEGRFYYISSRKADTAFTLNVFTRAAELGISAEELQSNEAEMKKIDDEMLDALYNDKMYLKSRNPDGSDPRTHFEYPAGAFFKGVQDPLYSNKNTGSVSKDGKYFYVEITSRKDGKTVREIGAIDIDTGELKLIQD